MGLGCAALTGNPNFPTYPNPLSATQNGAGLSAPATAITLLGKSGAVLMLVLLFMAVTSATSAELIAVSSLLTFDVYKTYIRPQTSSAALVRISHYGIILYSTVLAAFCCLLNAVGVNLTWLLTMMAIIVGGASIPVGMILLWKRMSTTAAIAAPWLGQACGLIAWFVTSWKRSGGVSIATTGDTVNAVAGNITCWGVGFLLSLILTYAFPAKYSSSDPAHVERSNKIQGITSPPAEVPTPDPASHRAADDSPSDSTPPEKAPPPNHPEKGQKPPTQPPTTSPTPESQIPTGNEIVDYLEATRMQPMTPSLVRRGERLALSANIAFALVAIILVPFTLFGTGWIYNRAFFTGWCVVSFMWVWASMVICVIYPVVESGGALWAIGRGLGRDLGGWFGRGRG